MEKVAASAPRRQRRLHRGRRDREIVEADRGLKGLELPGHPVLLRSLDHDAVEIRRDPAFRNVLVASANISASA
jgi:hypothetical protein